MPTELDTLFESAKRLYQSKAEETTNRLSLIRNSSLLDEGIKLSIDPTLKRLIDLSHDIEKSKNKDFKRLHELEREVKVKEQIIGLLENAISTFISHRSLSTTLPILFKDIYERFYKKKDENTLPFLVVSKEEEELRMYPNIKEKGENGKLLVGIIGVPPYSLSHIHEWILAGHEFGHIISYEKLGVGIEYDLSRTNDAIMNNYIMEISADLTAMQIFGPIFLETLLNEFTGAERSINESLSPKHPPIPWRIWICYIMAAHFDKRINKAKEIRDVVKEVINKLYPDPEEYDDDILGVKYDTIRKEVTNKITDMRETIRPINTLKECYEDAEEIKRLILEGKQNKVNTYSSDVIVIGGYLASREEPTQFKSYTQRVIDLLIRME